MEQQTGLGIIMLTMIISVPLGIWVFGAKFFGWIILAGLAVVAIAVLMWIWTILTGATRWAKRQ